MTTPSATFAIELQDDTSGAANAAATSLSDLKKKIDDDVKALREMQRAMRNLKGESGTAAYKKLKDMIAAQKTTIAAAQSKYISLGGTFGNVVKPKVETLSTKLGAFSKILKDAGGPAVGFGSKLSALIPLLTNPITLVVALTAATLAFAAALGVAALALGRFAVASADARRSELLQLEGFRTLRTEFGRVQASAEGMQAAIDRASDSTGIARSEAGRLARSFARVGFRGEALAQAVEGASLAAQVQGRRGEQRFRALAIQAALTGRSIEDVTRAYQARLGPIARRQMLSLTNQQARLRQGLDSLFRGVRIEAFLGAINEITRSFSQTTATGRALKTIIETLFNPIFDATGVLGPILRRFFQGMVIATLLLTIGFLRLRNAIRDAIGDRSFLSNQQLMNAALVAGIAVVVIFAAAVAAMVTVFALAAASIASFIAVVALVPSLVIAAGAAVGIAIAELVMWFQRTDFEALARSMIDGLVRGINRGVSSIRGAVTNLANQASGAFRSALGISSPSRVFAEFGANVSQGFAQGVDNTSALADDAVGNLIDSPTGAGRLGGATSISIGDVNINAGETSDPRALAQSFVDELASVLEGVSVELGAT